MPKILIVYVTTTGNTEKMANAIADGAKGAGADVTLKTVGDASVSELADYDVVAFGSPAMGAEVIEEAEMEPFFSEAAGSLKGKKVAVFGSYDWGDGEWLRTWEARCKEAGAVIAAEGLKAHLEPDDDAIAECKAFGAKLA
ncbi:MAG: flavodoxin [Synergistales bacterium]|nr:flavodoxin [Synergistales bacterium]MDY6401242.1 flavodoxin [Synergistales bacterium]MDY6404418.1 flavodoxin [Synergistales bacterium]MDY6410223.1 flavodoxin [Synergistales bacterium]MDY6414376.1 flavodoxin [Synergistales bacterium]